jgi:hypothetical protein
MGGKSAPTNNQMVQFEMQQAADARAKEELRQNRLNAGKTAIDQIFGPRNFGDEFYNKYTNAELNYNLPQLTTQYDRAKRDMTYDLARAGTLRSTAAGQAQGFLENERAVNEAGLRAKADVDTSSLRQAIASQQNQALNQLFATEDPAVAANTATSSAANAQLLQPNLSPLGELFKPLIIGAGSAFQGYNNQSSFNQGYNQASNPSMGQGTISFTGAQS